MTKVLVTGGLGYLGAHICAELLSAGLYDVTASYRSDKSTLPQELYGLNLVQLRFSDMENQNMYQSLDDYDAIVHTVSLDHHQSTHMPMMEVADTNVLSTWSLLEYFSKRRLQKFIYLSTIHVMGNLNGVSLNEDQIPLPLNKYGLTHLMSEQIVNYYNQIPNLNAINFRLSNGYGCPIFKNNNCWWLVINELCKMAIVEKKIVLHSDGSAWRDFVHVKDIARAVHFGLTLPETHDNTFNISSGISKSILELAFIVKDIYEKKFQKKINIFTSGDQLCEEFSSVLNPALQIPNAKISRLGFEVSISLESGINELLDNIQGHE